MTDLTIWKCFNAPDSNFFICPIIDRKDAALIFSQNMFRTQLSIIICNNVFSTLLSHLVKETCSDDAFKKLERSARLIITLLLLCPQFSAWSWQEEFGSFP